MEPQTPFGEDPATKTVDANRMIRTGAILVGGSLLLVLISFQFSQIVAVPAFTFLLGVGMIAVGLFKKGSIQWKP